MLQWHKVTYRERADSQWQKVECWYLIREVLKGRWDISWCKNPPGVVPLPNQQNLFLILRVLCFCHTKVKPSIFTYSSSFLLMT